MCGQRAFFTLRKTKETQTELIGGADKYMPVCRQHYVDGQIVVEATRIVLDIEQSAAVHAWHGFMWWLFMIMICICLYFMYSSLALSMSADD